MPARTRVIALVAMGPLMTWALWQHTGLAAAIGVDSSPPRLNRAEIATMSLSQLGPPPPDESNRVDTLPLAAALGERLFMDTRLSRDGTIACATCHQPSREFQDGRSLPIGAGLGSRRTMSIIGSAYTPWLFWDGRADSRWAQALGPIENPNEHATTRTDVVQVIRAYYGREYAALFGAMPSIRSLRKNATPLGDAAQRSRWMTMDSIDRTEVDRAFANVGKAIAAFERGVGFVRTRFDDYADLVGQGRTTEANRVLTEEERLGLALFVGKGRCATCHEGPRFTDDAFHNTGVAAPEGRLLDSGRVVAVSHVVRDPFNCVGRFSDADLSKPKTCQELRFVDTDALHQVRAFRTPSLRGVARRPPFMHAGQLSTLYEVVRHYEAAPAAPAGLSEVRPLRLNERERKALIAFLSAL